MKATCLIFPASWGLIHVTGVSGLLAWGPCYNHSFIPFRGMMVSIKNMSC